MKPALIGVMLGSLVACSRPLNFAGGVVSSFASHGVNTAAKSSAGAQAAVPPADISSCNPGQDVPTNLPQDSGSQLPLFDAYSWRTFAALVCDGTQGQHEQNGPRTGDGPRIFETYKSAWELFHPGTISTDFDTREDGQYNPCGLQANDNTLVIASMTKFVDVVHLSVDLDVEEVGGGAIPFGPLPAQNKTFVHYLTQFNRKSFGHLTDVLAGRAKAGSDFPVGAITLKSAWLEMDQLDSSRFYTRQAWIRTSRNSCKKATVGLIGLHIVQKTANTRNWIWSTFEHVDNVPNDPGPACKLPQPVFTFHDASCALMPEPPHLPKNDPFAPPFHVFNVVRTAAFIHDTTQDANAAYHSALSPSRWTNYQLVMTQWAVGHPTRLELAGDCSNNFPGCNPGTAWANAVMETFLQRAPATTCIGCHGQTAGDSDFVWALQVERPETRKAALGKLENAIRAAGIAVH